MMAFIVGILSILSRLEVQAITGVLNPTNKPAQKQNGSISMPFPGQKSIG